LIEAPEVLAVTEETAKVALSSKFHEQVRTFFCGSASCGFLDFDQGLIPVQKLVLWIAPHYALDPFGGPLRRDHKRTTHKQNRNPLKWITTNKRLAGN
jgi:hypothetical protein